MSRGVVWVYELYMGVVWVVSYHYIRINIEKPEYFVCFGAERQKA